MTQINDKASAPPPPPYEPSSASSTYIASRPPPSTATAHENVVVHRIQLGDSAKTAPAASALRFPRPEPIWMSRDVDRADWTAFGKALLGRRRLGPTAAAAATTDDSRGQDDDEADEAARRERISNIVSQWNSGFFEPRGLQILAQFGDDVVEMPSGEGEKPTTAAADANASSNNSTSASKSQGFGLKLGNSMLGVSLPPHSHGYGLRLGGVLLGLRVDDDGDAK